jgi:hypothetical protein
VKCNKRKDSCFVKRRAFFLSREGALKKEGWLLDLIAFNRVKPVRIRSLRKKALQKNELGATAKTEKKKFFSAFPDLRKSSLIKIRISSQKGFEIVQEKWENCQVMPTTQDIKPI